MPCESGGKTHSRTFLPDKAIDVIDEAVHLFACKNKPKIMLNLVWTAINPLMPVTNDKLSNQPVVDETLVDDLDVSHAADGVVEPEAMLSRS